MFSSEVLINSILDFFFKYKIALMSKIMCFLDRSLNATHMPIPICCVESEKNREKEKQSQRGEGKESVYHTKVTIKVTHFLPLGPADM